MRMYAALVLLFGAACARTLPLKIQGHFEFGDALAENKAQSLVWRSEVSGSKTLRVVDPVGTSAHQNPSKEPCCGRLICGGGRLFGNHPINDQLHFNTTGQNQSLIITGVGLFCNKHLSAIQLQYNNTWRPKFGECDLYPATHKLTFEFDSTEWFTRAEVSVIGCYPWALTLHTNKRQLPTCGVPSTVPNCARGTSLWGIAGYSGCWVDRLQFIWR